MKDLITAMRVLAEEFEHASRISSAAADVAHDFGRTKDADGNLLAGRLAVMLEAVLICAADRLEAELPKEGDWVPFSGGGCPVEDGVCIVFRYRDGDEVKTSCANTFFWENCGCDGADIIAYRVIP